jgi:hypothetical protein
VPHQDRVQAIGELFDECGCWRALLILNDGLIIRHVAQVSPSIGILQQSSSTQRSNYRIFVISIEKVFQECFILHLIVLSKSTCT